MDKEKDKFIDMKFVICNKCEIKKAVTWKCKACNIVLCVRCKNDHKGYFKGKNQKHRMLPLMNMQELKSRGHSTLCEEHPNETFQMYCQTCNCLICLECMTGKHNQHHYLKINDIIVNKRRENFKIMTEIKKVRIQNIVTSLEHLSKDRIDYRDQVNKAVYEVESQFEALSRNLNDIRRSFIHEIREKEKEDLETLNMLEKDLQKELHTVKSIIKDNEETFYKLNEFEIIDFVNKAKEKLEYIDKNKKKEEIQPPVFLTFDPNKNSMKTIFGCLEFRDKNQISRTIDNNDVRVVESFQMKNKDIRNICPIGESQAWINFYGSEDLVLANSAGKIVKSIQKDFYISDIAVLESGDILAADEIGSKIKKLTDSDQFKNFIDTAPFAPHGLYTTHDGEILASLRAEKESKVVRFSKDGIILQTLQLNDDKSSLFKLPSRLTQTLDGDIWVLEGHEKSLIIVTKDGQRRFCYKGPPGVRMFNTFNPFCTQIDGSGNIFVSDYANDVVYMLNQDGHLVKHILTKWQHGLMRPNAIGFDKSNDCLWISGMMGKVYVVEYKA